MMLCPTLIFSLALLVLTEASSEEPSQGLMERRYRGLKFGATDQDYIRFKPKIQPIQRAFSLCAWIKKIRTDGFPMWFAYSTSKEFNEIQSVDNGFFRTFDVWIDVRSTVSDRAGSWRHVCNTWSRTFRWARLYFDGVEIGSKRTPSGRILHLGGYMALGNEFDTLEGGFDNENAFGGELYKVNVFDKELNASEVKEMKEAGMCSDVEEKYGRTRYLKWEDLMLEVRSGNVTEVDVGCYPEVKKEQFNETVMEKLLEEMKESKIASGQWNEKQKNRSKKHANPANIFSIYHLITAANCRTKYRPTIGMSFERQAIIMRDTKTQTSDQNLSRFKTGLEPAKNRLRARR